MSSQGSRCASISSVSSVRKYCLFLYGSQCLNMWGYMTFSRENMDANIYWNKTPVLGWTRLMWWRAYRYLSYLFSSARSHSLCIRCMFCTICGQKVRMQTLKSCSHRFVLAQSIPHTYTHAYSWKYNNRHFFITHVSFSYLKHLIILKYSKIKFFFTNLELFHL